MKLPRGMRDFDGADAAGIEQMRREFLRVADLYGFEHADPSPLENLSTLETRSGPAIRDEIYNFEDKGGREVALRFDFTMGLTRRAVSQRSAKLPSKVSSFGGVFRYDEPQRGRYRYFHQWDLEVFGRPTMETDAEIIEATSVLFESLGLADASIQVCHRGLVESKVRQVLGGSAPDETVAAVLRTVDKAAKRSRGEILSDFSSSGGDGAGLSGMLEQILDFAGARGGVGDVERAADVAGLDGWDYLASLYDSLKGRGVRNVEVNLGIVRGLDYYSGMVFEVFDGAGGDGNGSAPGSLGALAGGGRYDALTAAFGRDDLGAAGVAGGVERIMLAMRARELSGGGGGHLPPAARRVAVLYATSGAMGAAARIASSLRRAGIAVAFDTMGRSLKKQLGDASQNSIHAAIIVGPRELRDGMATLRMMDTGTQSLISISGLQGDDPRAALGL